MVDCANTDSWLDAGFTREAIGATFEGETKTPDGQTWADVEADGLSSEVSVPPLGFAKSQPIQVCIFSLSGIFGRRQESSRE